MKKFFVTIIHFVLPLVMVLSLLEYGLRHIPNDYSYKNQWLKDNVSSIRILSLGSSHGYYGIKPDYFPLNAFNAAHISQSLKYDEFIYNKFLYKADSLQYVILPISYFTLFHSLEQGAESWRIKNYCLYYHYPFHKFKFKYNSEVLGSKLIGNIKRLYSYFRYDKTAIYVDSLGWGRYYLLDNRDQNWKNSGIIAAKRHTKEVIDETILIENMERLDNIIDKCKEKDIICILLTTPTYQTYRENLKEEQLNLMLHLCDSIADVNDNVLYLNMLSDTRFNEDDFYDADHLNEYGAEKLTRIIALHLDSLRIIK